MDNLWINDQAPRALEGLRWDNIITRPRLPRCAGASNYSSAFGSFTVPRRLIGEEPMLRGLVLGCALLAVGLTVVGGLQTEAQHGAISGRLVCDVKRPSDDTL